LLIVFVLAGLVGFLSSCNNDPVDLLPPSISFTLGEQTVDEGDAVNIAFVVTTTDKLESVRLFIDDAPFGTTITDFTDNQRYSYQEQVVAEATETFVFKVIAQDKAGNLTDEEVTVTVTPASGGTLTEFTVTLGDQGDSEGSFINLNNSDLFFASAGTPLAEDNDDVVDMVYYWGNTGDASMYSPQGAVDAGISSFGNLGSWGERATTVFVVNNSGEYDAATFESVAAEVDGVTAQGVTQLAENDLIFFKLDDGLCGVIKAGTIVPGKDLKEITFTYKLQVPNPTK
jgi:hypothetical protein